MGLTEEEQWRQIDAEACRMNTWEDQIEFGIIKCAECKNTICGCEAHREYLVIDPGRNYRYLIEVDTNGDRKRKEIRNYRHIYSSRIIK